MHIDSCHVSKATDFLHYKKRCVSVSCIKAALENRHVRTGHDKDWVATEQHFFTLKGLGHKIEFKYFVKNDLS